MPTPGSRRGVELAVNVRCAVRIQQRHHLRMPLLQRQIARRFAVVRADARVRATLKEKVRAVQHALFPSLSLAASFSASHLLDEKETQTTHNRVKVRERSRPMDTIGTVKAPQRRVGRRTFLAVAGLGACGAGALAAPHVAPLVEQNLQQAAFNVAAGELDQLEGVSLDAAIEAAAITAAAVRVIVVPVARLVAALGTGALGLLLSVLDAAHNALAFVHVSTTPLDLLRGVIVSWQAGLASLPIALDTYATADIKSAEAYLMALKRKVAQQQNGASA